jgi:cation transport regulator ChaC/diadenosine tetraphosphate (Ap4A) HIT family hydrolase
MANKRKWVFVYGSLMDSDEMKRALKLDGKLERKRARIDGYSLALNKWSVCRQSVVLGLQKGGECQGFAYELPEKSIVCIDLREGYRDDTSGYLRKHIQVHLVDDDRVVPGCTYVTNEKSAAYRKSTKASEIGDKKYFQGYLSIARRGRIGVPKNVEDLLLEAGVCALCREDVKFIFHESKVNRCVYQDESCIILVDRDYLVRDHLIVVLKRKDKHPYDLATISEDEFVSMMRAIRTGCHMILSQEDVERVYVACLNESNHVHFHLVPRRKDDPTGFGFLAGGEFSRGRSRWEILDDRGKIERIGEIQEAVSRIGRKCGRCTEQDCHDRTP